MRKYAAHPQNETALDWLNGCRWLARSLAVFTVVLAANFYVIHGWNSEQWVYWLGFYGVGAIVSVWQTYRFLPLLMLRQHLRERSILRLDSTIAKLKWCWGDTDIVRVDAGMRYLLQDLRDRVSSEFFVTRRYFYRRPSKAEIEALRSEGEWL